MRQQSENEWSRLELERALNMPNNSLHPTTGPVTTRACARPAPDPVAGEPNVRMARAGAGA